MAEKSALDEALARFEAALSKFEKAALREVAGKDARTKLETELQSLKTDRSALAAELDRVKNEAGELREAHAQASARIDNAMSNIKTMLGHA